MSRQIIWVILVSFFLGCDSDQSKSTASNSSYNPDYTGFIIHNRSQFILENIYIYPPDKGYEDSINLIAEPLAIDELLLHKEFPGQYLITVTRRANESGELLAFTTTDVISLFSPIVVEYYDSEFRIYNIKVSSPTQAIAVESNATIDTNNTF